MIRVCGTLALTLVLAACAQPQYRIVRDGTFSSKAAAGENDAHLQKTAFQKLRGLSFAEAIHFLKEDGFNCAAETCVYVNDYKRSTAEIWFGTIPPGERVLDERYASKITYQVKILNDPVQNLEDIGADFRWEQGDVPWHRPPRPSDFEVIND